MNYHIAENVCRRILSRTGGKTRFSKENFHGLLAGDTKNAMCSNFMKKLLQIATKLFPLKNVPLYSILEHRVYIIDFYAPQSDQVGFQILLSPVPRPSITATQWKA